MMVIRCTGASGPGPGRAATIPDSSVPGSRPLALLPSTSRAVSRRLAGLRHRLPGGVTRPGIRFLHPSTWPRASRAFEDEALLLHAARLDHDPAPPTSP